MATQKQIDANRRNAQNSTGPKTAEGKSRAKLNALKHGMTADTAVLPYEDPNAYEDLREALIESHQPANASELMLVELVANSYWRLLRARRVETASFRLHLETLKAANGKSTRPTSADDGGLASLFAGEHDTFRKLERYQSSVERAYYRALESLRKAQNDRLRNEKIGSVSKPQVMAAHAGGSFVTMPMPMPRMEPAPAKTYTHAAHPPLPAAGAHV